MFVRQVSIKTDIFYALHKKEKIYVVTSFILSTEFCLFYTRHKISQILTKQLCGRVACEDVRANFLFQIF
jgi:hypothetical protein